MLSVKNMNQLTMSLESKLLRQIPKASNTVSGYSTCITYRFSSCLPNSRQRLLPCGCTASSMKFLADGSFTFPPKFILNFPFLSSGFAVSSYTNLDFSLRSSTASRLFLKVGLTVGLSLVAEKARGPLKPAKFLWYLMVSLRL
jgi:hypothetical protein